MPNQTSQSVDATPSTFDQAIGVSPVLQDQTVDARPVLVSTEVMTMPSQPPSYSDQEEFSEKSANHDDALYMAGYVMRSATYVAHLIRSISPTIFLRLYDMWSVSVDKSKEYSMATLQGPLLFSPKISPAMP